MAFKLVKEGESEDRTVAALEKAKHWKRKGVELSSFTDLRTLLLAWACAAHAYSPNTAKNLRNSSSISAGSATVRTISSWTSFL